MQVQVNALPKGQLTQANSGGERSAAVRQRVVDARTVQLKRNSSINAQLSNRQIKEHCPLTEQQQDWLEAAIQRLKLSARAYHRILKVARTIADLEDSDQLLDKHLAEAVGYRLDIDH